MSAIDFAEFHGDFESDEGVKKEQIHEDDIEEEE